MPATGDALYFSHFPNPIINSLLFRTCRNICLQARGFGGVRRVATADDRVGRKIGAVAPALFSAGFRIRVFEVPTVGQVVVTLQYLATVRELMKDRQI